MDAVASYILRICCCALIAAVVLSISPSGPGSRIRRLVCGLFLAFVVISPLRKMDLGEMLQLPEDLYQEGEDIAAAAQEDISNEISSIITERVETYILDEAGSLGIEVQVKDIQLDPDTLEPIQVEIWGDISPYNRSLLSDYLENTLGIGKEGQLWMS